MEMLNSKNCDYQLKILVIWAKSIVPEFFLLYNIYCILTYILIIWGEFIEIVITEKL
mgnify:CR=1 FL=1